MNIRMASLVAVRSTAGLLGCLVLFVGCGKREPKITGKPSDPPVSLRCAWKAGNCYHIRLEMEILTDSPAVDPKEKGLHRVTYAQECLVTATNVARGGNIGLEMEILSMAMERARGAQVALSYDSEQGGETCDDLGYVPILDGLIGGRLRFLISPDGKMLRADGIPEWLAHAMGDAPVRKKVPRVPGKVTPLGARLAPMNAGGTNADTNIVRNLVRVLTNSIPAPATGPTATSRRTAASTLRTFFHPDLFRQMVEFSFPPATPVHVGEEWKKQGDTPINGRGRFKFDGMAKFEGWQKHGRTNCARVAVHGTLSPLANASPPAPASAQKQDPLKGTIWIDPQLGFPVATVLDSHATFATRTPNPTSGTNNLASTDLARSVRQNVTITLLEATPIEALSGEVSSNDGASAAAPAQ